MKAKSKSELAELAGVSVCTLGTALQRFFPVRTQEKV